MKAIFTIMLISLCFNGCYGGKVSDTKSCICNCKDATFEYTTVDEKKENIKVPKSRTID